MAEWHPFTTFEELYGNKSTLREIVEEIGQFRPAALLHHLSCINLLLSEELVARQQTVLNSCGDQDLIDRINKLGARIGTRPIPFFRQQLLLAIRLVLQFMNTSGTREVESPEDHLTVAKILLKVADHCTIDTKHELSSDLVVSPSITNCELLARLLLENEPDAVNYIARYYQILFVHIPNALEAKGFERNDWETAFKDVYGIPLDHVFALALSIYMHLRKPIIENKGPMPGTISFASIKNGLLWGNEEKDAALSFFCEAAEAYGTAVSNGQAFPLPFDFGTLRRKPFVEYEEDFKFVDRTFLLELTGENLLRLIQEAIPVLDRQNRFGSVLGLAVQNYVLQLFRLVYPEGNPIFADRISEIEAGGNPAPDFEIAAAPVLQMFEVKGQLFSEHAKYSLNPSILAGELHRFFLRDSGTKQLATRSAHYQAEVRRLEVPHAEVRRVQPVLINLDIAFKVPALQSTLNSGFRRHLEKVGGVLGTGGEPRVENLISISLEELEMIIDIVAGGVPLTDVLDKLQAVHGGRLLSPSDILYSSGIANRAKHVVGDILWKPLMDFMALHLRRDEVENAVEGREEEFGGM